MAVYSTAVRIAYIGAETYASCAMALLEAGHTITHLFSPSRSQSLATVTIDDVAKRAGIRAQRTPVRRQDIQRALEAGAEAILCVAYPWRLPIEEADTFPALNIHPSPLPEGRGPAPLEWAILTGRTETAVTIHQIVHQFDAGPILYQIPIPLGPNDTLTSLQQRFRTAAGEAAVAVFADFERLWAARRLQGPATYCRLPRRADRTLDWSNPTVLLDRQLRAFPEGRRFAILGRREARLGHVELWVDPHLFTPGQVLARSSRRRLIATLDGFAAVEVVNETVTGRLRILAWPFVRRVKILARR